MKRIILMALVALVLAACQPAEASPYSEKSPNREASFFDVPVPEIYFGFVRVDSTIPRGAVLVDAEILEIPKWTPRPGPINPPPVPTVEVLRVYYVADPFQPYVTRYVDIFEPPYPVDPENVFVSATQGLMIFDAGEESLPEF